MQERSEGVKNHFLGCLVPTILICLEKSHSQLDVLFWPRPPLRDLFTQVCVLEFLCGRAHYFRDMLGYISFKGSLSALGHGVRCSPGMRNVLRVF
jgi:hypothetical protein